MAIHSEYYQLDIDGAQGRAVESKRVAVGIISLAAVVFLSLFTFYYRYHIEATGSAPFAYSWLFNLGAERNAAAWTAGALLFLSGIAFLDRFWQKDIYRSPVRWGFLLLGCIVLVLSADEVGSLHERVLLTASERSLGFMTPHVIMVLGGASGIGVLGGALYLLRKDAMARPLIYMPPLAFACFVTAVLMELQEWALFHSNFEYTPFLIGLRLATEETVELVGMLLLVIFAFRTNRGFMYSGLVDRYLRGPGGVNRQHVAVLAGALLTVAVFCCLLASVSTVDARDPRGNVAEWFASVCYLYVAILLFFDPRTTLSWRGDADGRGCLVPLVLLAVSAFSVAASYHFAGDYKLGLLPLLYFLSCLLVLPKGALRQSMGMLNLALPLVCFAVCCLAYVASGWVFFARLGECLMALGIVWSGFAAVAATRSGAPSTPSSERMPAV